MLPAHTIEVARGLAHFVVENAKPARAFLQSLGTALPIQEIDIVELGDAPDAARCAELLAPARAAVDLGLLSDAGCPGIADPGALHRRAGASRRHRGGAAGGTVVDRARADGVRHERPGLRVPRLPAGEGRRPRTAAIQALEAASRRTGHAQIFIETPYRNVALLAALAASCKPATRLCVAADLTLPTESIVSKTIARMARRAMARATRGGRRYSCCRPS